MNNTTNLSTYPYPAYESNRPAGAFLAAVVAISAIIWIVQSKQMHFRPRRSLILIMISHLTIFVHLILHIALSTGKRNSKAAYTISSVSLALGQRMLILANYDFLTQVRTMKRWMSRSIIIGSVVIALTSSILMAPAGTFSYNPDTVNTSFQLRQASAALVLILTVLFYPIWIVTKTIKIMTKQAIILMIIASVMCVIAALYVVVTSAPDLYIEAEKKEYWAYIFQLVPIVIGQLAWTILHPIRSLPKLDKLPDDETKTVQPVAEAAVKPDIDPNIEMVSF